MFVVEFIWIDAMAPTDPFSLPFASYAWQCAQKPCDKRGHFSLGWAFNLFEDFQPGEIVAVDKRSNLKHCHAIVAQQIPQVGIPHDELRAALALQGQARLDTVDGEADRDPKNPTVSRVLLHFPGGLGSFSASRLTRVLPSSPQRVLLVNETITYRRLAKTQVGKADGVLEIGSSFGECTQILTKHARAVIGIDNSPELVEESRRRFPFCQIELLNCFERERLQFICTQLQEGTENFKIFVDIGGDRTSTAVCRILVLLDEVLGSSSPLLRGPCLVVVKSERLASAAAESCDTAGNICNLPEWWQSCVVPSSTRQQRKWGMNFTGWQWSAIMKPVNSARAYEFILLDWRISFAADFGLNAFWAPDRLCNMQLTNESSRETLWNLWSSLSCPDHFRISVLKRSQELFVAAHLPTMEPGWRVGTFPQAKSDRHELFIQLYV